MAAKSKAAAPAAATSKPSPPAKSAKAASVRRLRAAVGLTALAAAFFTFENARAGGVPLRAGVFQGANITTSSQQIIGPSSILPTPVTAISVFLYLENPVPTGATVCISFGAPATISGTTCAAGEITLEPGAFRYFDSAVPTGPIYAIGSAAGELTVGAE
jgi:hypothetical protein